MSTHIGKVTEAYAEEYLIAQGLKPIEKNFRSKMGEIDLIMEDGRFIVFVEVRYRSDRSHENPKESITHSKQRRIIRTAQWYIKKRKLFNRSCRFDVIALEHQDGKIEAEWIKGAFIAS